MSELETKGISITRANVDALLDAGRLECKMKNGNWWKMRRNGATKRWKTDANRIRIPFKMGMYGYGAIETEDFIGNCPGALRSDWYRAV